MNGNLKDHILSDCWALENFHKHHGLTFNYAESAALALKRGVHLNCGVTYAKGLKDAIDQGLITEQELDKSLKHLYRTRFKLGMFDDPKQNPYRSIGTEVINDEAKQQLALEAAHKSIVLLKNDNALPISPDSKFIYMTGPLACKCFIVGRKLQWSQFKPENHCGRSGRQSISFNTDAIQTGSIADN